MQTIHIIAPGNLKETYWRDACAEYCKRLRPYAAVQIHELREAPLPAQPTPAQIQQALQHEGERMQAMVPHGAYTIALCIEGKPMSSTNFSKLLCDTVSRGVRDVVFFIGSSFGLSQTIKDFSHCRLSFSEMTFPHQMMRVMLLEQIYRAKNLAAGGKYHK